MAIPVNIKELINQNVVEWIFHNLSATVSGREHHLVHYTAPLLLYMIVK